MYHLLLQFCDRLGCLEAQRTVELDTAISNTPNPSHARSGLAPPLKPLLNCLFWDSKYLYYEKFRLRVLADAWAYCRIRVNLAALLRGSPNNSESPAFRHLCMDVHKEHDFDLGVAYRGIMFSQRLRRLCSEIASPRINSIYPASWVATPQQSKSA